MEISLKSGRIPEWANIVAASAVEQYEKELIRPTTQDVLILKKANGLAKIILIGGAMLSATIIFMFGLKDI